MLMVLPLIVISVSAIPINKSYPSVLYIKELENKIEEATKTGQIRKAVYLESKLERDVLKAVMGIISTKTDKRIKRQEIRELSDIVFRNKRAVQALTEVINEKANGNMNGQTYTINNVTEPPTLDTNTLPAVVPFEFINQQIIDGDGNENATRIARGKKKSNANLKNQDGSDEIDNEIENFGNKTLGEKESQESEEDTDDGGGGGGGVTNIITSFLGTLSDENGGVDLDAVAGLLGSLSTENPDGSYDFSPLSDLLGGLFAPAEDGGGGSDVGAFLGGFVGAIVRGIAGPGGANGAGTFLGRLITNVLPGLSAPPAPSDEDEEPAKPPQDLDSGGFISGLIKTLISSSSGNGGGDKSTQIMKIKFTLFRVIFSLISGLSSGLSASKG